MIPEAYGCLSVARNVLESRDTFYDWRRHRGRYLGRRQAKIEKAQKLFSKANRLLAKRGQQTLGDFNPNKVFELLA